MNRMKIMLMAGAVALLSTHAIAGTITSAKNLADGEEVTVSGTVENFSSRHPFTLRDNGGTVKVDLSGAKAIVLKNGQTITVTGTIDKDLFGTDIDASSVHFSEADMVAPSVAKP